MTLSPPMEDELDRFSREMEHGLKWLLSEVKRLRAENRRLLEENHELRQIATLNRLLEDRQSDIEIRESAITADREQPKVPEEALEFYEKLPDRLNFLAFFKHAESEHIAADKAREYMLIYIRARMLRQRGRQIEKRRSTLETSQSLSAN